MSDAVYTPGRAGWKLLVVIVGAAMFLFGASQLWTLVSLFLFGQRANAQVGGRRENQGRIAASYSSYGCRD